MSTKAGIKTSEYWLTLATSAIALLAAAGIIGPDEVTPTVENVKTIVFGIYSLLAVIAYIKGRVDLKKN